MKHIPATFAQTSFHCPICSVYAEQTWSYESISRFQYNAPNGIRQPSSYPLNNFHTAKCDYCNNYSIWLNKKMVYPLTGSVEMPNPDLCDEIKNDYNEAKDIVNISPRGSSALLRLALQKLCKELGEKGKNINDDIASLVKRGLPAQLQQALDSIRVIGNHAVHPGVIDLNDNMETAYALFNFINIIADYFITQPNKIAEVFNSLPQKDKDNIEKRDG